MTPADLVFGELRRFGIRVPDAAAAATIVRAVYPEQAGGVTPAGPRGLEVMVSTVFDALSLHAIYVTAEGRGACPNEECPANEQCPEVHQLARRLAIEMTGVDLWPVVDAIQVALQLDRERVSRLAAAGVRT